MPERAALVAASRAGTQMALARRKIWMAGGARYAKGRPNWLLSCVSQRLGAGEEEADLLRVLDAGRGFDPRRHIDGGGARDRRGRGEIVGIDPARQHPRQRPAP